MNTCNVVNLGLVDYLKVWELQKTIAEQVIARDRGNTLFLAEHPNVYTIGRRGNREDIFLNESELNNIGISIYNVDRGGEVTYHGPGQLVAYPIINLKEWGSPLHYVRTLEQIILNTLKNYDMNGELTEGLTGVWIEQKKIGSIGVKIKRGVSYHGLSLNINTNLAFYRNILPCGYSGKDVTSMESILDHPIEFEDVAYVFQYHFGKLMGFRMTENKLSFPSF